MRNIIGIFILAAFILENVGYCLENTGRASIRKNSDFYESNPAIVRRYDTALREINDELLFIRNKRNGEIHDGLRRDGKEQHPTLRNKSDPYSWGWIQGNFKRSGMPLYFPQDKLQGLRSEIAPLLPEGGRILDLASGKESLIYPNSGNKVIGLGLSRRHMQKNPALERYVLHDLNKNPNLPFKDGDMFDAVIISFGIMYLTRPVSVLCSVKDHLKPGGILVIVFHTEVYARLMAVNLWNRPQDYKINSANTDIEDFDNNIHVAKEYLKLAGFDEKSIKIDGVPYLDSAGIFVILSIINEINRDINMQTLNGEAAKSL